MARATIVTIDRDRLLGSQRLRGIPSGAFDAYLRSIVICTETRIGNPLCGCMCRGKTPMTLDDWQRESGIRKASDARKYWDLLFEREAFEWYDHGGRRYARVTGFAQHQERMRKARYKTSEHDPEEGMDDEQHTNGTRTAQERHTNDTGTAQERHTNGTRMVSPTVENKGVTPEKVSPYINVPFIPVRDPNPLTVNVGPPESSPKAEPSKSDILAERIRALEALEALAGATPEVKARMAIDLHRRYGNGNGEAKRGSASNPVAIGNVGLPEAPAPTPTPAPKAEPFTPPSVAERMRVVEHICKACNDRKSEGNWRQKVGILARTPEGWKVLQNGILEVESRINHKDPTTTPLHNPGAWLNRHLTDEAARVGIDLNSRGTKERNHA